MAVELKAAAFLAVLALLVPSIAAAAMVQCTEPNGSLYIGISPPANCVPVDKLRATPGRDAGSSRKTGELRPTPTPKPPAVVLRNMSKRLHGNGRFVEGSVANGASFPVYNVRVCVDDFCDYTSPSTLQPGATATFSIPANPNSFEESRGLRITWDVVREGNE
jgi:hypothetical protein